MVCCTPMTSVVPHGKACGQYIHIHWLHVTIYYEHKKSHIKWFVVMDIDDNVGATWHNTQSYLHLFESKIHPILTPTCFIYVGYTCNLSFLNGRRNQCWFHIKVVDINLHYECFKLLVELESTPTKETLRSSNCIGLEQLFRPSSRVLGRVQVQSMKKYWCGIIFLPIFVTPDPALSTFRNYFSSLDLFLEYKSKIH